jgi:5-methylcytosine-specific restriction endonuclease McrA
MVIKCAIIYLLPVAAADPATAGSFAWRNMPAFKDLTGERFGRWTVIRISDEGHRGKHISWLCRCDCGREKSVCSTSLKSGRSNSCGCLNSEVASKRESKDLLGMTFSRLTVIERVGVNKQWNCVWRCKCKCGKETVVSSTNLLTSHTQSCGCLGNEKRIERKNFDIVGEKHNKLTVVEYAGRSKTGERRWKCVCECGEEKIATTSDIRYGSVKSCRRCSIETVAAGHITHGLTGTPEYNRARAQQRRDRKKIFDTKWNYRMRKELKELFKECVYCGSTDNLEIDHVIPLSKGRGLEPGNATILCQHHNGVKKDKPLDALPEDMRLAIVESAAKFKIYWESLHPETTSGSLSLSQVEMNTLL